MLVVGRDAFLEHAFAQQSVEEGRLAGVELTDDDQQEEFVQLAQAALEEIQVVLGRVEARQNDTQLFEQLPFLSQ